MPHIAYDHRAVAQDRVAAGSPEFSRSSAHGSEVAHVAARAVEDDDAQIRAGDIGRTIEHVEVALGVEGHPGDPREGFPVRAVHDADPVDLLELGDDSVIPAGQFDDRLCMEGGGPDSEDHPREDHAGEDQAREDQARSEFTKPRRRHRSSASSSSGDRGSEAVRISAPSSVTRITSSTKTAMPMSWL